MLGLALIVVVFVVGDAIARRFIPFHSIYHRLAVAFLTGSVFTSVFLYAAAMLFSSSQSPLLWANLSFFLVVAALVSFQLWYRSQPAASTSPLWMLGRALFGAADAVRRIARPDGSGKWDLVFFAFVILFASWLVYATLDFSNGGFDFSIKAWSDFGANLSLSQSFALGNNFPTEHPFLSGEPIRYHFLFWFLAADVSYLGLNLVTSINLLSILSFAALVCLIATLAEALFESRVVGRIAGLFFFLSSSSLSYISFLASQPTLSEAFAAVYGLKDFVKGYPFRGDDWGSLTVAVFAYQRHLISAVGILLIAIIFLVRIYRANCEAKAAEKRNTEQMVAAGDDIDPSLHDESGTADDIAPTSEFAQPPRPIIWPELGGLVLCGLLIGAMPYWNSAVFVSAAIVLVALLVLLPARAYTAILFFIAMIVALPQVLYLQSGDKIDPQPALYYFGYIVPNATLPLVLEYIGWLFALKLALLVVAMIMSSGLHRRLLIAFTGLVVAVFMFQFSIDVFNNHKLLNVWGVLTSVFAAYAIWTIGRGAVWRTVAAVLLTIVIAGGAVIDLFPLHNDAFVKVKFDEDRLAAWVQENTRPRDVFLSERHLSHPILFSGRKLYMGNPLFPWAAGYNTPVRESKYRRMLSERDPVILRSMLRENNVAYVAIDQAVRTNGFVTGLNEDVYRQNFELVFDDPDNQYNRLVIFKVPE